MCDKKNIFLILFFFIILSTACSIQKHYRILSFFFDGVPNPEKAEIIVEVDTVEIEVDTLVAVNTVPLEYVHKPYQDRKCSNCHDNTRMGMLNEPMPDICVSCHTDFQLNYGNPHGPVTGGHCNTCHHPHKTRHQKLLIKPENELCFHCHEANRINDNPFHSGIGENTCLECHNPHGSNNHMLLEQGSCSNCHDDFNEKFEVLHGPVAIGYCSSCHTKHGTGMEKLLTRTGQALCLHCHDGKLIFQNENHEDIDDADCYECHNPHGGSDKYMFY